MANLPSIDITIASQVTVSPKFYKTDFGNGYSQRAGMGLNGTLQKWNVEYIGLTSSEKDTLYDFFIERGGYQNFNWTDPVSDDTRKYICTSWNVTSHGNNRFKMNCMFEEVADL